MKASFGAHLRLDIHSRHLESFQGLAWDKSSAFMPPTASRKWVGLSIALHQDSMSSHFSLCLSNPPTHENHIVFGCAYVGSSPRLRTCVCVHAHAASWCLTIIAMPVACSIAWLNWQHNWGCWSRCVSKTYYCVGCVRIRNSLA